MLELLRATACVRLVRSQALLFFASYHIAVRNHAYFRRNARLCIEGRGNHGVTHSVGRSGHGPETAGI